MTHFAIGFMRPSARVNVLLPARNAAATLSACLRSLQRQSFPDFRCHIIDDGSSDDTRAIARHTAAQDDRFEVHEGPSLGLVGALQRGLHHCTAAFTARMDADDIMHRDRLRLQVELMEREQKLAGAGCHVRAFPAGMFGNGLAAYTAWLRTIRTEHDVYRDRFIECPLLHPTWMLRTEVLKAHGYCDRGWAEDWDLLLRLLHAGHRLSIVPRILHGWRRGPLTATTIDARYGQQRMTELRAFHLCAGPLHAHDRYVLWGHGDTGRRLRHELLRLGRRPEAIVELDPRKLGQRIDSALVVPPAAVMQFAGRIIVVSVANHGPRTLVRERLAQLGKVEGRDFVCAA